MQSSSSVCVSNPKPMVYIYPKVQPLLLKKVMAKNTPKVIKQTKQAIQALSQVTECPKSLNCY